MTVAEALGSMSHLMAHDKLEEQLPKLLPTILGLYKKNAEHYIISKVKSSSPFHLIHNYWKCLVEVTGSTSYSIKDTFPTLDCECFYSVFNKDVKTCNCLCLMTWFMTESDQIL